MTMVFRQRLIVSSVTLAVLAVAVLGAVGIPSALSIRKYVTKISQEQEKIDALYALRRYIRNSAAGIADTKVRLGALSSFSLLEGQELAFVTAIEKAAENAGVEHVLTLETANQKDVTTWEREIPLRLQVSGDFPKVLAFMNAAERLPYVMLLDGVQVIAQRSGAGDRNGRVDATFTGNISWIAQNAPDFTRGKDDGIGFSAEP